MLDSAITSASSLERDARDRLGRLPQAGVDHLEAGVHQRARHDLRALVVAVEAGLGEHHLDALASRHDADTSLAMISFRISLVPPPISVKRTSRR